MNAPRARSPRCNITAPKSSVSIGTAFVIVRLQQFCRRMFRWTLWASCASCGRSCSSAHSAVICKPGKVLDHVHPVRADVAHRAQRAVVLVSMRQFQSVSYSSQSCEYVPCTIRISPRSPCCNHAADLLHHRVIAQVVLERNWPCPSWRPDRTSSRASADVTVNGFSQSTFLPASSAALTSDSARRWESTHAPLRSSGRPASWCNRPSCGPLRCIAESLASFRRGSDRGDLDVT